MNTKQLTAFAEGMMRETSTQTGEWVTVSRIALDEMARETLQAIKALEAAERERDELRHPDYLMWHSMACKNGERTQKAESELARRDAAAGEPEFYVRYRSDGGYEGPLHKDATEECRKQSWSPLYTAAPPAVLPPEKEVPPFLTHQAGKAIGWNDCIAEALNLGAQPQKPVVLPALCVGVVQHGHAVMVPYPGGHWFDKTLVLEALDAANVKWEVKS